MAPRTWLDVTIVNIEELSFYDVTGISDITINGLHGEQAEVISNMEGILKLKLVDCDVRNLSFLSSFPHLESLRWSPSAALECNLNAISNLRSLENLEVINTRWEADMNLNFLRGLTGLESLNLNGNLTDDPSNISQLTLLRTLSCRHTYFGDKADCLMHLHSMEDLDLRDTHLPNLNALCRMQNLKHLDCAFNEEIDDLTPLLNLSNLQTLDVTGCDIRPQDANFLYNKFPDLHIAFNNVAGERLMYAYPFFGRR